MNFVPSFEPSPLVCPSLQRKGATTKAEHGRACRVGTEMTRVARLHVAAAPPAARARARVQGQPSKEATAHAPQSLLSGMNSFLQNLDITFRRDPTNFRPRINKLDSQKDQEQKSAGTFYYLEEDE